MEHSLVCFVNSHQPSFVSPLIAAHVEVPYSCILKFVEDCRNSLRSLFEVLHEPMLSSLNTPF